MCICVCTRLYIRFCYHRRAIDATLLPFTAAADHGSPWTLSTDDLSSLQCSPCPPHASPCLPCLLRPPLSPLPFLNPLCSECSMLSLSTMPLRSFSPRMHTTPPASERYVSRCLAVAACGPRGRRREAEEAHRERGRESIQLVCLVRRHALLLVRLMSVSRLFTA